MKRQRQNQLLEYIDEHEVVTVAELMERFQISKATLNRDLTELEAEKKIHKIHGGAASQRAIFTYEPIQHEKENLEQEYKAAIARAAMKYVYQSASFFMDAGTTVLALAKEMVKDTQLGARIAITNDMKTGMILAEKPEIDLILLGGRKRNGLYSLGGGMTERMLEGINADIFFMGTDAVDVELGVSNVNFDEVGVKQKMIKSARKVVLLADYTKFNQYRVARVCQLDEVDVLITDSRIPQDELEEIKKVVETVIIAR